MATETLVFEFDEKPRAIVAAMDGLQDRGLRAKDALKGTWKLPLSLIAIGIGIAFLDLRFGYDSRVFAMSAAALILLGVWTSFRLRKAGNEPAGRNPGFLTARRVIHTLRDDLAPKRNLHGTLDLTGSDTEAKLSRTKEDARGRTVAYYRDDWLSMKAKLYDGSMLRLGVVRRRKIREPYWKRGRVSGKMKRKPAKLKSDRQHIDIRVSANTQLYTVSEHHAPAVGQLLGRYRVESVVVDGGLLRVTSSSASAPSGEEILDLLLATYGALQRKELT